MFASALYMMQIGSNGSKCIICDAFSGGQSFSGLLSIRRLHEPDPAAWRGRRPLCRVRGGRWGLPLRHVVGDEVVEGEHVQAGEQDQQQLDLEKNVVPVGQGVGNKRRM